MYTVHWLHKWWFRCWGQCGKNVILYSDKSNLKKQETAMICSKIINVRCRAWKHMFSHLCQCILMRLCKCWHYFQQLVHCWITADRYKHLNSFPPKYTHIYVNIAYCMYTHYSTGDRKQTLSTKVGEQFLPLHWFALDLHFWELQQDVMCVCAWLCVCVLHIGQSTSYFTVCVCVFYILMSHELQQ